MFDFELKPMFKMIILQYRNKKISKQYFDKTLGLVSNVLYEFITHGYCLILVLNVTLMWW